MAKKLFGEWGSGPIPANIADIATYFEGWHLVYDWKQLEPTKDSYTYSAITADLATLALYGLNAGITIFCNPKKHTPNYLYVAPFNVPVPMVTIGATNTPYGYYLDSMGSFRTRLYKMLDDALDYLATQSTIAYFQCAEGHENLLQAYIGNPTLSKYNITAAQFLTIQKDYWQHCYDHLTVASGDSSDFSGQLFDLIINTGSDPAIADYVIANLPNASIRKSKEGVDYHYNLDAFDWVQIDQELAVQDTNPGQLRKKAELTYTPDLNWYLQAANQNMMQIALSALNKGNDFWQLIDVTDIKTNHQVISDLVNLLAANQNPARSAAVAWWSPVTKIDGSDTTLYPTATYGNLLINGGQTVVNNSEYLSRANLTRLQNIQHIYNPTGSTAITACLLQANQFGTNYYKDSRQEDKWKQDIGMKINVDDHGRFLVNSNHANAKKYWRIGKAASDYWGRYAIGWKSAGSSDNKLFFKLSTGWKANVYGIHVLLVYFDEGTTHWGFRNVVGSYAHEVTNTNTKTFKTADFTLDFLPGQLTGSNDFSIEAISGGSLGAFVYMQVKKMFKVNASPIVSCSVAEQITGNTAHVSATASDSDGTIAAYAWAWCNGPLGEDPYPNGATPTIATPAASDTDLAALTVNGNYYIGCTVTDNQGATAFDSTVKKRVASIVGPTAVAGGAKSITQPTKITTVGGADTQGTYPIATINWTVLSAPDGSPTPTIATPHAATTNLGNMTFVGQYLFQKEVLDNQDPANTDTATVTVTVLPNPTNVLPVVNAGANTSQTGTTATLSGTATDSDGVIVWTLWTIVSKPVGATVVLATPDELSCAVSGMTVNGDYIFGLQAGDNSGGLSLLDKKKITKTATTTDAPIACAGGAQNVVQPDSNAVVGCADTPGTFPIGSITWSVLSKPTGAATPTFSAVHAETTTVNGLTTIGDYTIRKTVKDNQAVPLQDIDDAVLSVITTTSTQIKFGVLQAGAGMTIDNKIILIRDKLNCNIVRTSITCDDWDGTSDRPCDRFIAGGLKLFLNVNWKKVGQDGSGNKIPNLFPTGSNLTTYLNKLAQICTVYSPSDVACIVIENEPLTAHFYDDSQPIANYIAQVKAAIDVCHAHGHKVTDGAVHIPYQLAVWKADKAGTLAGLTGKNAKAKDIIWSYATDWQYIDYINTHAAIAGDDIVGGINGIDTAKEWADGFNYMRNKSGGKALVCNEYSVHDAFQYGADEITIVATQHVQSQLAYSIIYSNDLPNAPDDGHPFSNFPNTTPNNLGLAFLAVVNANS